MSDIILEPCVLKAKSQWEVTSLFINVIVSVMCVTRIHMSETQEGRGFGEKRCEGSPAPYWAGREIHPRLSIASICCTLELGLDRPAERTKVQL